MADDFLKRFAEGLNDPKNAQRMLELGERLMKARMIVDDRALAGVCRSLAADRKAGKKH